ncbi:MAG: XRE family transcriptional regulator [Polyangiales bacterium]
MDDKISAHIGHNVKALRVARNLTQAQLSKLAELPRATWANLESGDANPTIGVLLKVSTALQVSIEELISPPPASARHYAKTELVTKTRGTVSVRKLLPDPLPGLEMDRMELPPRARMTGVPHRAGTREYLTCETGELLLIASGERWVLQPGDVVVFRGDQPHSYHNEGSRTAIGYSVVAIAPSPS